MDVTNIIANPVIQRECRHESVPLIRKLQTAPRLFLILHFLPLLINVSLVLIQPWEPNVSLQDIKSCNRSGGGFRRRGRLPPAVM